MNALVGRLAPGLAPATALPPAPEVLPRAARADQAPLPLATEGVLRWVWESRYGSMLIEVIEHEVFVNGQRVEPHVA